MPVELKDADDRIIVKDSEVVQDGDPDTTYTLQPLFVETHREITRVHTEHVLNKRTHQREPRINWEAVADDLIDHVLVDWVGIVHKGQPLPCERVYKLKLDAARRDALLEKAGYNEVLKSPQERRAESFREPEAIS